jgi:manganese/zinc/iron transport system permease protein
VAQAQFEIVLIAVVVAASCALVGSWLVLRRTSLLADAISHAILFGIVLAFFLVETTASPAMIIAATLTGILTVYLVETLARTGLVKADAAIGLVFPFLFAVGVILVSRFASNVHLDVDAVLLGELAFAPFDRLVLGSYDLGPRALWLALGVAGLNLAFILLFFKELKLTTFDAGLAVALGFTPALIHYGLMTLVSLTAVSSFEAVGSVLVVALMIAPPAAAYLLTDRLNVMLMLAVLIAVLSAVAGFFMARALDASIAGSMATMTGAAFLLALLFAPERGLVARSARARNQKWQFAGEMLLVHLAQHEGGAAAAEESSVEHMAGHMRWEPGFGDRVVEYLRRRGLLVDGSEVGQLALTDAGRSVAAEVVLR